MAQDTIQVADHFPPGSKVAVVPRVSDFAPPSTTGAVKTVTVNQQGEVKLDGLKAFGQYWLSDGERNVAYNVPGRADSLAEEQEKRGQAMADIRSEHPNLANVGTLPDPRPDTSDIPAHNWEKGDEPEPAPAAKYTEMSKNTWQRTGADIGTAYPVDPAEIQPQPARDDVKPGVPQRDGADEGYAALVDPAEVQPAARYEDEKGKQRLGADTGQAEPIAKGSKKEQELVKSSSESKAKGATVPKAGTDKVPARKPKGTPKATKAQAKKLDSPIKAEAKRAVKKGDES